MRPLRIDRSEFEATLGSRLLEGVHLFGQAVTKEAEYAALRARILNWQTMNFVFLRGAFRDALPSAGYRALFIEPDVRSRRLADRVDALKDALARQLRSLRALDETGRAVAGSVRGDAATSAA
ncbi:MAG TPA: hypothetical protein VNL91_09795 [Thermoanaerobaculia bacterium]|nr:hypothetical protein [Thermoanaerobaculia bacterium]